MRTIPPDRARKIRDIFLSLLLVLIFISTNPVDSFRPWTRELWVTLNKLGLDISMTPLTSDMMMMYDPTSQLNLYKHHLSVIYRSESGEKIIPVRSLPFYGFKVPAILFVGMTYAKVNTRCFVHAMSYKLGKLYGPGTEFMLRVDTDDNEVKAYGLNIFMPCF